MKQGLPFEKPRDNQESLYTKVMNGKFKHVFDAYLVDRFLSLVQVVRELNSVVFSPIKFALPESEYENLTLELDCLKIMLFRLRFDQSAFLFLLKTRLRDLISFAKTYGRDYDFSLKTDPEMEDLLSWNPSNADLGQVLRSIEYVEDLCNELESCI